MDCNSCGKRGRGNGRGESSSSVGAGAAKKKAARVAAEEVVITVVEEEGLLLGVDEGMPWATWWLPLWEVETILGDDDDVWDFDIWGLKATTTTSPSTSTSSSTHKITDNYERARERSLCN